MAVSESLGTERVIGLRQGTVRYREVGSGSTMVFIHGALVNGDVWRNVVPLLAGAHRCITPDLPLGSHVVSMAADADLTPPGVVRLILEFLEELDLQDVTIVANDAGGALAQMLVTTDPSRVGALVLTNCDSFWGFPPRLLKPIRWTGILTGRLDLVSKAFLGAPARSLRSRLFWRSVVKRSIEPEILDLGYSPQAFDQGFRGCRDEERCP